MFFEPRVQVGQEPVLDQLELADHRQHRESPWRKISNSPPGNSAATTSPTMPARAIEQPLAVRDEIGVGLAVQDRDRSGAHEPEPSHRGPRASNEDAAIGSSPSRSGFGMWRDSLPRLVSHTRCRQTAQRRQRMPFSR